MELVGGASQCEKGGQYVYVGRQANQGAENMSSVLPVEALT